MRALLFVGLLAAGGSAQDVPREAEKAEIEVFAARDPYTLGDPVAVAALGYRSLGGFELIDGSTTDTVTRALGGEPLLWVETEHFKLGSSLRTYERSSDPQEKARLADELSRLGKRMSNKRLRRGELDPWLRLHLFAQRLEELYAQYCLLLELSDDDFVPSQTDLWAQTWNKPIVLLTDRRSTLGRFTETFLGHSSSTSYRAILPDGGTFYGLSAQSLRESDLDLDVVLHCFMVEAVTLCLCDSFKRNLGSVPLWFKYGLGHAIARDIDPRWARFEGHDPRREALDNAWKWEPRVRGMVQNKAAPSFAAMLAWDDHASMSRVDHLFAWSRTEWLLGREEADSRAFLLLVAAGGNGLRLDQSSEERLQRQTAGVESAWGASLDELEAEWTEYVKKRYDAR